MRKGSLKSGKSKKSKAFERYKALRIRAYQSLEQSSSIKMRKPSANYISRRYESFYENCLKITKDLQYYRFRQDGFFRP